MRLAGLILRLLMQLVYIDMLSPLNFVFLLQLLSKRVQYVALMFFHSRTTAASTWRSL